MLGVSAIFLCLYVFHNTIGYPTSLKDTERPRVPGDKNPSVIERNVYDLSELCPIESEVMKFGDELIVETQRPWSPIYKTNLSCSMTLTTSPEDVGIIVNSLFVDTVDCRDYFRLTPSRSLSPSLLCGPDENVTGQATDYMHETIQLEWHAAARDHDGKRAAGVRILFTAFVKTCKPDQACFRCTNGLIIDQKHMCNGRDNCGDNSDEGNCGPPKLDYLSIWIVIVSTLLVTFVLSLALTLALLDLLWAILEFLRRLC